MSLPPQTAPVLTRYRDILAFHVSQVLRGGAFATIPEQLWHQAGISLSESFVLAVDTLDDLLSIYWTDQYKKDKAASGAIDNRLAASHALFQAQMKLIYEKKLLSFTEEITI